MKGSSLVGRLKTKLGASTDAELADKLGYTSGAIQQMKARDVSEKGIAELVERGQRKAESDAALAISPIVEFFPISKQPVLLDKKREDHANLRANLESACGLYCFYNSELEIIYIGKTVTNTIWHEMHSVLTQRDMPHYERYVVAHPRDRYTVPNTGVHRISRKPVTLLEAATYFSAYSVPKHLVTSLETLFIRMIPNDLLNVRIEGNTRLRAYRRPVPKAKISNA